MRITVVAQRALERMAFVQNGSHVCSLRFFLASSTHLLALARLLRCLQEFQLERFTVQMLAWVCEHVVPRRAIALCTTQWLELNRPVDTQSQRDHATLCKRLVYFQILVCVSHSKQRPRVKFDAGKRERWFSTTLLRVACRTVQTVFALAHEFHDVVHATGTAFSIQIFGQLG